MNIQQLRAQIAALQDSTMDENKNFRSTYDEGKFDALSAVDALLDSVQEEPVSEDLEKTAKDYSNNLDNIYGSIGEQTRNAFKAGAKWQKEKDSILPTELGEYINELSKQFPEVSFAKLSRIAVRVAKWQKEQFEKNRLKHCNSITNEQAELEQGFIDQHLDKHQCMPTFLDAIEYGIRLQKEQIEEALLSEVLPCFMHGGEADEVVAKLDEVLNQKK